MVGRHGFPPIPIERWNNVQAAGSYLALPRALDKVLPVIGSNIVKDAAGRRLTLSLSRLNKKTGLYPEAAPEVRERVAEYNRADVEGLVAVHTAVGDLPARERELWELDHRINRRGIGIDTELVTAAKTIAEGSTGALVTEFAGLTDGLSPYQVEQTRCWVRDRGHTLENLQEETVQEALDTMTLPDDVRRVLEIRQAVASTSLKKLDAMLASAGAGGRARGLFQYHAATPGRWSATLIQPQNMPRPTVDITTDEIEEVVTAIKNGKADALRRWGEPLEVLASALRFALVAAEGSQYGAGDFAMIETCVLLALAGQHDKCELIAADVDIYRDMAATIYGLDRADRAAYLAIPKNELTVEQAEQRQVGKNTILGCGYQMGPERFRSAYLRHLGAEEANRLAEEIVKVHYRRRWARLVPPLWYNLERTARQAMLRPGETATAQCGIAYRLETVAGLPCLVCTLLNGKRLHLMDARVSPDKVDIGGRPVWTYWAYRRGQWREIEPYGGQLTENVVQALARELLADAMLRFEVRGYPVVMHCHDEIVVEHPGITETIVREIMEERPAWAVELGVPVTVEPWIGKRYRK
jgi:DNA polymerase